MEAGALGSLIDRQQYLQARASQIFASHTRCDSPRIERAVFDYLVAKLVLCHGYGGISEAMLANALQDARDIVGHSVDTQMRPAYLDVGTAGSDTAAGSPAC